jgi:hypothetical protein
MSKSKPTEETQEVAATEADNKAGQITTFLRAYRDGAVDLPSTLTRAEVAKLLES